MKKQMFASLMLVFAMSASAQTVSTTTHTDVQTAAAQVSAFRFGYLSYKDVLESAADYAIVRRNIAALREKYDAEMKRVTEEFNIKYESFLDGQRDFAPAIREKRQAELQELMEKNVAFKKESERLLQQAEADALSPLRARLAVAVRKVGSERGLAFVLNTDNNAVPYINMQLGEDISAAVSAELK